MSQKFSDQYFADRGFEKDFNQFGDYRWIKVNDEHDTIDCTIRVTTHPYCPIATLYFDDDGRTFPYDIYDEAWLEELLYAIYRIKPKVKNANS